MNIFKVSPIQDDLPSVTQRRIKVCACVSMCACACESVRVFMSLRQRNVDGKKNWITNQKIQKKVDIEILTTEENLEIQSYP